MIDVYNVIALALAVLAVGYSYYRGGDLPWNKIEGKIERTLRRKLQNQEDHQRLSNQENGYLQTRVGTLENRLEAAISTIETLQAEVTAVKRELEIERNLRIKSDNLRIASDRENMVLRNEVKNLTVKLTQAENKRNGLQ